MAEAAANATTAVFNRYANNKRKSEKAIIKEAKKEATKAVSQPLYVILGREAPKRKAKTVTKAAPKKKKKVVSKKTKTTMKVAPKKKNGKKKNAVSGKGQRRSTRKKTIISYDKGSSQEEE